MSAPSTLLTNRQCRSARPKARSARYAIAGPRSLPPIPMLTTVRMAWPVAPGHAPPRTRSANVAHAVEHPVHVGHHVVAVDLDRPRRWGAQRGVQHGSLLGGVDRLAARTSLAPGLDSCGAPRRDQALTVVVDRCFE